MSFFLQNCKNTEMKKLKAQQNWASMNEKPITNSWPQRSLQKNSFWAFALNKSPISKTKPEPGPKPKTKLEPALKLRPSQAEQAWMRNQLPIHDPILFSWEACKK